MQTINFRVAAFARNGQKDVFIEQFGQHGGTSRAGKQTAASVERQQFEQRQFEQQIARFGGFAGENFFGEIIENIFFRLVQNLAQIERGFVRLTINFLFGNLPHQLQSRDPAVRPFAVFGDHLIVHFDIERLSKQSAHFVVGKQQIFSGQNQRGGLRTAFHRRQRRQIARRDNQMKHLRRIL